jgi:hypothetical protein
MNDASYISARNKSRVLYAFRTIQQAAVDNGIKNYMLLEGGHSLGSMTYTPNYYNMITGAIETTAEEKQSYIDSVSHTNSSVSNSSVSDNTVPDPPTNISAVGGNAEATVTFTPPVNNGGSVVTLYTVTSSPGGFRGSGISSPIVVPNLSNNTSYTFRVVSTNSIGDSVASSASNSITTPSTLPEPPNNILSMPGIGEASVSFTPPVNNSGSVITLYTVTSSPGGFTGSGTSSPIVVLNLSNNTSYTFTVVSTNSVGDSVASSPSNSITTTTPSPSTPIITGIISLTTSLIVTFSAPASFGTITNYEYSLDGTTFTPLSPANAVSPITISSLTPTTLYRVGIRAINNVPETGDSSNTVSITTATTQITETFSTPISTTWTAPANVRYVQYLCVAGGGGGGAAYSKINVLGTVPVQSTPTTGYWIYNGTSAGFYVNGYLYYDSNKNSIRLLDPVRCTPTSDLQPSGIPFPNYKWHSTMELVYLINNNTSGFPYITNYGNPSNTISSANNKICGGGGGGAGGEIKGTFTSTSFYSVTPGMSYTVIVGDGGEGGLGGTNSETAGTKGGDSTFDINVSEGGSGGQPSRITTSNTDGYNNGGQGDTNVIRIVGGYGGQGVGGQGQQGSPTTGGSGGAAASLAGPVFSGEYSPGGAGGVPDTVASATTAPNIGMGGAGTGAELNSYASGIKGGTGVVIIKYYI